MKDLPLARKIADLIHNEESEIIHEINENQLSGLRQNFITSLRKSQNNKTIK
jgi:hypothetical protein